jgi:hypothetical protein
MRRMTRVQARRPHDRSTSSGLGIEPPPRARIPADPRRSSGAAHGLALPTPAEIVRLQRGAGNRAVCDLAAAAPRRAGGLRARLAVQRMVHQIGEDSTTALNAEHLRDPSVPASESSEQGSSASAEAAAKPLAALGAEEELQVVTHGSGPGRLGGMDAVAFDYLVAKGLRPELHKGMVTLVSCESGTPTKPDGAVLGEQIQAELSRRQFTNRVKCFDGLVRVSPGGTIGVIDAQTLNDYDAMMRLYGFYMQVEAEIAEAMVNALRGAQPPTSGSGGAPPIAEDTEPAEDEPVFTISEHKAVGAELWKQLNAVNVAWQSGTAEWWKHATGLRAAAQAAALAVGAMFKSADETTRLFPAAT